MKGLLLPSSLPSLQRSRQNVRVPFSGYSGPRIPGLNEKEGFGGPGLDSPQLMSCLRIKWDAENTPDNIKKNDKQGYRRVPKINKINSKGKKTRLAKQ